MVPLQRPCKKNTKTRLPIEENKHNSYSNLTLTHTHVRVHTRTRTCG